MLKKNSLISKPLQLTFRYEVKLDATVHRKMNDTIVFKALEKETSVTYVPGGCSYNAMRVFHVEYFLF